jgi:hypothetical protein
VLVVTDESATDSNRQTGSGQHFYQVMSSKWFATRMFAYCERMNSPRKCHADGIDA